MGLNFWLRATVITGKEVFETSVERHQRIGKAVPDYSDGVWGRKDPKRMAGSQRHWQPWGPGSKN